MRSCRRLLVALLPPCLAALCPAQVPPKQDLDGLLRAFAAQRDRLYAGEQAPTARQENELLQRQAAELAAFVDHEATGADRWEGRLVLADMRRSLRDRAGAVAALEGIDAAAASGRQLLAAAGLAADLAQKPLRDRFVSQALDKPASADERLAMARVLMTSLREVDRGEKIFAAALAAAKDDEARARVRWLHAEAVGAREDVPETGYYDELDRLAADLPGTYYGGIARDRGKASQFKIGGEPIPFHAVTTAGDKVALDALRGRAVVLTFWTSGDPGARQLVAALEQLRRKHGADLFVLGIGMDKDAAAFAAGCQRLGATFPQVCDGRGQEADLALRYRVETTPTLIVIDRAGRIAGLNLHVDTQDARDELQQALDRALRAQ